MARVYFLRFLAPDRLLLALAFLKHRLYEKIQQLAINLHSSRLDYHNWSLYDKWATTIGELECAPAWDWIRYFRHKRLSKKSLHLSSAMKSCRNLKSCRAQVLHHSRGLLLSFVFQHKVFIKVMHTHIPGVPKKYTDLVDSGGITIAWIDPK